MQINEMYACAFSEKKKKRVNLVTINLDSLLERYTLTMLPEISARRSLSDFLERQGGREISNPSQYLTDPFYTASQLGTLNVPKLGTAHI